MRWWRPGLRTVVAAALLAPAPLAAEFALPGLNFEALRGKAAQIALPAVVGAPAKPVPQRVSALKVSLKAHPPYISARTRWGKAPAGTQKTFITISPESKGAEAVLGKVVLKVVEVRTRNGYNPGPGELKRDPKDPARWHYTAFEEPKTEKHPQRVTFTLVPELDGKVCGEPIRIQVRSVFMHLTGVHSHRPGQRIHMPQPDDYELAWRYARWKHGIDTSKLTKISFDPDIEQAGLTNPGAFGIGRYCRLGRVAFLSENETASVLGHENVHGGQSVLTFIGPDEKAEVPAYQWEIDNAAKTGVSKSYIQECRAWILYYQGRGPRP